MADKIKVLHPVRADDKEMSMVEAIEEDSKYLASKNPIAFTILYEAKDRDGKHEIRRITVPDGISIHRSLVDISFEMMHGPELE